MSNNQIYELAILGRATWELHSLNNEGTVGNVTEPRTVVLADGTKTDAVSGEMLKHIHAIKMWELESDKNKFCKPCRELEPSRAAFNPNIKKVTEKNKEKGIVQQAVEDCVLCDLHGFLVTKPAVARPSTIEFGWAVGIPSEDGNLHRSFHIHARHAVGGKKKETTGSANQTQTPNAADTGEPQEEDATSQMIYHRPTRSGQYAVISVFRPWRIGLNNVDMQYVKVGEKNKEYEYRIERYRLALNAYRALFLNPEGAMTTTRLPHSGPFEGAVVYTTANHPVPLLSPLHDGYTDEVERLAKRIKATVRRFGSLDEFAATIDDLEGLAPYQLS
jgi:CRISPR-associated protein Cst2